MGLANGFGKWIWQMGLAKCKGVEHLEVLTGRVPLSPSLTNLPPTSHTQITKSQIAATKAQLLR